MGINTKLQRSMISQMTREIIVLFLLLSLMACMDLQIRGTEQSLVMIVTDSISSPLMRNTIAQNT
jgi:hypothetical protein